MTALFRWTGKQSDQHEDDILSPKTIAPEAGAAKRSSQSMLSSILAPSRDIVAEDPERISSPLRSEIKAVQDKEGLRGKQNGGSSAGSSVSSFRLQEAPRPRKRPSGYFSAQHTLEETAETQKEAERGAIPTLPDGEGSLSTPIRPDARHANGRPSVQFARPSERTDEPGQITPVRKQRTDSNDEDGLKSLSLFQRLRNLTSPVTTVNHARQSSGPDEFLGTPYMTPASERDEPRFQMYHDGSEAEGDVDESSGPEEGQRSMSRHQKRRRRQNEANAGSSTAPSTPRNTRFPIFAREHSASPSNTNESRPNLFTRRATMNDIPEDGRAGVSEDEGRERIAKRWRRGIEGARGLSYSAALRRRDRSESPEGGRPTAFRRLTALTGLDGTSSPFRARADRGSLSAARWRQVKAGLKSLGQKKKDARVKVDYQKSAELMAQLLAGAPAALFLASMYQRDEHGHKKIPALLEQLKVSIPSSATREDKSGDRHMIFTINLEYGNGPSRMTWTIHRSLRDFANLHLKYKLQSQTERYIQLRGENAHRAKAPRFPRSAFPYLRGFRGLADEDFEDDDVANEIDGTEAEQSGPEGQPARRRRQSSGYMSRKASFHRRKPSSQNLRDVAPSQSGDVAAQKAQYNDRQRKKLEMYLQQMIRWLIFRPESTRLCKFLELSALSMRLSVEGGYHGKEGLLTITSKRALERGGLRAVKALPNRLRTMPNRHRPKWFMIRDSYIVAVDSPESLVPSEVFLVDADFSTDKRKPHQKRLRDQSAHEIARTAKENAQPQNHLLKLYNAERKLRLLARNERQLLQFKDSVDYMKQSTVWAKKHRFDSYAPVRTNVFARWLVDGRDHMWQVSRAIENARNFVYIHDWWLSPELYLRRPAAISQRWRLDRLLLEKAQQGVKIFVIVYRNIESAIPIDSEHTKAHLLELHPNIIVQRSPNQFRQNQFFWAHHEKLVVVDNAMAFVGGVDLCFGRWDDPHHVLTDDKLTGFESEFFGARNSQTCQTWPGKDYSNPRVQDFYELQKPYEEMYDRTKVPRMPWHDIAMCIVGQPARDVARHFVQRWNYILRQRNPSRPTPVLLPPPEFEQDELDKMGMTGTCQIQILRSCGSWSIGTPNKTEHSIMNAYEHLIRNSDHFVYIENQFFISSCSVEGTKIQNRIGDALVDRIELADQRGDKWRACIVIPLMPGFQSSVDSQDGTSVRLIMQCQYRSICRGESSIFGRLRAKGIDPARYIEFYALRQWGKIGPNQSLTTEQLYIHAKCMIVDDRAVIIGSANINERSMLGDRDSEVAAVIIDQENITSTMGGSPYQVGVFPHTLRMRLMREHLGIDVDRFYDQDNPSDDGSSTVERMQGQDGHSRAASTSHASPKTLSPLLSKSRTSAETARNASAQDNRLSMDGIRSWLAKAGTDGMPNNERVTRTDREQQDLDVAGFGTDNAKKLAAEGVTAGRETFVNTRGHEVLAAPIEAYEVERHAPPTKAHASPVTVDPRTTRIPPWVKRMNTHELGLTQLSQLPALPAADDTDIGGPPIARTLSTASASAIQPLLSSMRRPAVEDDCMRDPLTDSFFKDIWHKVAENNTKLYRQVFRCMPDSEVQSWKEYREFNAYNEKFMQSQGLGVSKPKPSRDAPTASGPPGSVENTTAGAEQVGNQINKVGSKLGDAADRLKMTATEDKDPEKVGALDDEARPATAGARLNGGTTGFAADFDEKVEMRDAVRNASLQHEKADGNEVRRSRTITFSGTNNVNEAPETTATQSNVNGGTDQTSRRRKRAATNRSMKTMITPEEVLEKDEAEQLLNLIQGHLVLWPYDWLEKEERGGNWLYNIDQIAPLEIYD